jgi:hypothetical protein
MRLIEIRGILHGRQMANVKNHEHFVCERLRRRCYVAPKPVAKNSHKCSGSLTINPTLID